MSNNTVKTKTATVKARYLRISPKKCWPWLRRLKGLKIEDARALCRNNHQKILKLAGKLIESGVAAAKEQNLEEDRLRIEGIVCQQGPILKRRLIKSRGRTDTIKKKTSHLQLFLVEDVKRKEKRSKKSKSKRNGSKD